MSKSSSKKSVAKSAPAKKSSAKKVAKVARELSPVQVKLLKLFQRPNGATLTETVAAGANYPAAMALKMFAKRGFKTSIIKKEGEPKQYRVLR